MSYADLLSRYIEESELSLGEIAIKLSSKGLSIDRSYISKLKNGNKPPASEEVTRALAEVTGGDVQALLIAGHIEKAPKEVKTAFEEARKYSELYQEVISSIAGKEIEVSEFEGNPNEVIFDAIRSSLEGDQEHKEVFATIVFLIEYLENHRAGKAFDGELYRRINVMVSTLILDYDFDVSTHGLAAYPEYAAEIIAKLKNHYYPNVDSIKLVNHVINFSDYVDKDGNPIFHKNPYPDILNYVDEDPKDNWHKYIMKPIVSDDPSLPNSKKVVFFEELERDLNIDLSDPKVQKQLKRAAKIFFADED